MTWPSTILLAPRGTEPSGSAPLWLRAFTSRDPPARVIADDRKGTSADLILVPDAHAHAWERFLAGDPAGDARHHARRSVLVARARAPPGAILAAFDASPASLHALQAADALALGLDARLVVAHVRTPGAEWDVTPGDLPPLRARSVATRSTRIVDSGEVGRILQDIAAEEDACLIAVGVHEHPAAWRILGQSVGDFLAHHGAASLLVVKEAPR